MQPQVNVIVICYNAVEYTRATVDSLLKTTHVPFCLTIIDNGSVDGTRIYLDSLKQHKYMQQIHIIRNKANMGVGYAYNQGLNVSINNNYEFSCFCNNDLYFANGWLDKMLACMQAHPNVAALNPLRTALRTKYNSQISTMEKLLSLDETDDWRKELESFTEMSVEDFDTFCKGIVLQNKSALEIIKFPDALSTCVCLCRTAAYKKLGYFADPDYPKYGGEDIDMCWKIMALGYDCAICHDTYVHHFRGKSIKSLNRQELLRVSNQILYKKWQKALLDFLRSHPNVLQNLHTSDQDKYWMLRYLDKDINFAKELQNA